MGDAAGETPHRLHLLRLPQLLLALPKGELHRLSVTDVTVVGDDGPDGRIVEAIHADRFAPPPGAVLVQKPILDLNYLARVLERVGKFFADRGEIVGMDVGV